MFNRKTHLLQIVVAFIGTVLMWPCPGFSAEETASQTEDQPVKITHPTVSGKMDSTLDWVRLKDGEWIAGILRLLRNDRLYFHSKKFKELDIDWDDVREVRTNNPHMYVFDNDTTAVGLAVISETQVEVETTAGIKRFKRDNLMSILAGDRSELDRWSLKLGLGFTMYAGNTDSLAVNANGAITRRDRFTRVTLDYQGDFGAVDQKDNLHRHLGHTQLDLYVYPRTVFSPIIAYGVHDKFQNIKLRVTVGPGASRRLVKLRWLKWDAVVSVGYQYLASISAPVGDQSVFHDLATLLGTSAKLKFSGVKLKIEWKTWLVPTNINLTYHRAVALFEVKLNNDWLVLETTATWNRVEDPQTDEDGNVPDKNDIHLVVGLSLRLH